MVKRFYLSLLAVSFFQFSASQMSPILQLKFDENQGANSFTDSSGRGNDGNCRMSGASCPQTGAPGKVSKAAFFAASCPRAQGSSVDECDYAGRQPSLNNLSPGQQTDCYFSKTKIMEFQRKQYSLAASCGSAVMFNPVSFTDGTVMLWYKEFATNDGNPQQLFNPLSNHLLNPTDKTILRSPADFGWDISLVGGSEFFLGRLGPAHWGGFWCGRWHVAPPAPGAPGDARRGWDHLAWHHAAFVFAGDSALVYIDGQLAVAMTGVGNCAKQVSFVGKRTVRYTGQSNVREVFGPGAPPLPPSAYSAPSNPDSLRDKEWSTNYFKGFLDDLRVYPSPLDPAALAAAMAAVS